MAFDLVMLVLQAGFMVAGAVAVVLPCGFMVAAAVAVENFRCTSRTLGRERGLARAGRTAERAAGAAPAPPRAVVARGRASERCPYCRSDASLDAAVACAACMARHHAACWDEHGECSACGGRERFASVERTPGHQPRERGSQGKA